MNNALRLQIQDTEHGDDAPEWSTASTGCNNTKAEVGIEG